MTVFALLFCEGSLRVVTLSCANCVAPLTIKPETDVFACAYCGTQQKVERDGGVISLKRVEVAIKNVQRGTDRTASELALIRLDKEIAEAELARDLAVAAQIEKDESPRSLRKNLSGVLLFFGWVLLHGPFGMHGLVAFVLALASSVAFFKLYDVPEREASLVRDRWDADVSKLKAKRLAERRALDQITARS